MWQQLRQNHAMLLFYEIACFSLYQPASAARIVAEAQGPW